MKYSNHAVAIPTYNEHDNIETLSRRIFAAAPGVHLYIVDDNSPDGTGNLVKILAQQKYPNLHLLARDKKDGLGRAYVYGFEKILTENSITHVTMMDADLSHEPEVLPKMFEIANDYDLIIGSRYIKGGSVTKKWEWWRKMLSFGANLYLSLIFHKGVRDWTTGYNTISCNLLHKIDLQSLDLSGYAFISSLKYHLIINGARVKEVPIFFEERNSGKSKMSGSIIKEGIIAPWRIITRGYGQRRTSPEKK